MIHNISDAFPRGGSGDESRDRDIAQAAYDRYCKEAVEGTAVPTIDHDQKTVTVQNPLLLKHTMTYHYGFNADGELLLWEPTEDRPDEIED